MALPYSDPSLAKKQQVADMFDNISPEYDKLNRILSFGIDKSWRKTLVGMVERTRPSNLLDIATGTGDVALAVRKAVNGPVKGVDIAEKMLDVGREKIQKIGASEQISLTYGDSENLSFENDSFDAITCAFGVRNFENLEAGLKEMHRVLRKGGKTFILEFSKPEQAFFKAGYDLYSKTLLPAIGKLVSKDERAYSYLPESIREFPSGDAFLDILKNCGFITAGRKPLTLGVCTIYWGQK